MPSSPKNVSFIISTFIEGHEEHVQGFMRILLHPALKPLWLCLCVNEAAVNFMYYSHTCHLVLFPLKERFPYIPVSAVISFAGWRGASCRKLRVQHSGQASGVTPASPTMKDVGMHSVVKHFRGLLGIERRLLKRF